VKAGIAMAATLTCIQENPGLAVDNLGGALPASGHAGPGDESAPVGLRLAGPQRARRMGADGSGQEWAEVMPDCCHGHSGWQIPWNPAVVDVVRELA
jgi:hypothetical protein